MGCDIHLFCETREPGGKWVLTPVTTECLSCNGTGKIKSRKVGGEFDDCYMCEGTKQIQGYQDRNYDLFAILANVRNGYGFAGVPTGEGFIPIADPRGLPEDISDELVRLANSDDIWKEFRDKYGAGWLGDHSWSWITLEELLSNDWDRYTVHRGHVEIPTWIEWKDSGDKFPKQWSGACWGGNVRVISEVVAFKLKSCLAVEGGRCVLKDGGLTDEAKYTLITTKTPTDAATPTKDGPAQLTIEEFEIWLSGDQKWAGKNTHIVVESSWQTSYKDSVYSFYTHFMPALVALGKGPENTRIVFGFDS